MQEAEVHWVVQALKGFTLDGEWGNRPDSGRHRQPQEAVCDEAQTSRAWKRIPHELNSICEGDRI